MLYKRLIINGEEYLLAVNQTGQGAPTESTVGAPGVLYMDTDTEKFYKCTAALDGVYTWKEFETGGSGGSNTSQNGNDGFSPIATVMQTDDGAIISITDKDGTTTASITNGKDGADGAKGDKGDPGEKGEQGAQGIQGEPGTDGKDGVSVTHSWNGTTLTVTSASGTSSTDLKGDKGETGTPGADGEDYVLTEDDKSEIAELAAQLVEVPTASSFVESPTAPEDTSVLWLDTSDNSGDTPGTIQPLTFTGAVNATYDGSEAVSVEIPEGGSGGSAVDGYTLVKSVTLESAVTKIEISTDDNGNVLSLYEAVIEIYSPSTANGDCYFMFDDGKHGTGQRMVAKILSGTTSKAFIDIRRVAGKFSIRSGSASNGHFYTDAERVNTELHDYGRLTLIGLNGPGNGWAAGTIINIYARG